jgi:hypothetical protein
LDQAAQAFATADSRDEALKVLVEVGEGADDISEVHQIKH